MAYRSMWTGVIALHKLVPVPVSVVKAVDGYEGAESLRQVCECHHEPFARFVECATDGTAMATAAEPGGAKVVKAVETDDGFVPLDPDQLKDIDAAVNSAEIEVQGVYDYGAVPMELADGMWYVRADKKANGSEGTLAALHAALAADARVIVGRWAHHGHEHIVAIHPVGDVLVMNRLLYAQEVREPDEACVAHAKIKVDKDELALTRQLLATKAVEEFDPSEFADRGVELRQEAIEAALSGKTPAKRVVTTTSAPPADLKAVLAAALAA